MTTGRGLYTRDFYRNFKGNYVKNWNNKEEISKRKSTKSRIKNKSKLGELETIITWDFKVDKIFKCYCDELNQMNIYYISSFLPEDKEKFKKQLKNLLNVLIKIIFLY